MTELAVNWWVIKQGIVKGDKNSKHMTKHVFPWGDLNQDHWYKITQTIQCSVWKAQMNSLWLRYQPGFKVQIFKIFDFEMFR